ncbi:YSIRK-type signal peptide-containing protein [Lactobacillus helveticus]|uniref:YSIRK-type signal peptide-containing protein n=1 Tax=Lactobacillus helveticus TaxID=1587 RepID=UPI0030D3C6ED
MRRKHNLNIETANQRQRFSIRKLTIGAASVLLGTTFLFGAGQTVQADSVNGVTNGEPASAEVKSTDEEQTQSNEASRTINKKMLLQLINQQRLLYKMKIKKTQVK